MHVETIQRILETAPYASLALRGKDGMSVVPVSFAGDTEAIFFHGKKGGRKMGAIRQNPRIFVSIVELGSLIPSYFSSEEGLACPATQFFASVEIEGSARELGSSQEKARALEKLMRKYQPEGHYLPLDNEPRYAKALEATAVVEIAIEQIRTKVKYGQKLPAERWERIHRFLAERGTALDLETLRRMEHDRKKEKHNGNS